VSKCKPDSIWMYHNADGSEAGAVLRWNLLDGSKTFGQISKVDGGWICAAKERFINEAESQKILKA